MPLRSGQVLNNRYRIVRLLGQGAMGAVYRAWDLQLEGVCALKENLDPSPEAQRQFEREARLLFGLRHLGLARVSDYFFVPGQGQYLVMEYIEGEDLETRLEQAMQGPAHAQSLSEAQVLPWLLQLCDALTYLHTRTPPVIHRDIKPANIKITPEGQAVLVDFGIAKAFDPSQKTQTGARAATPGYAPPEQFGQGITDAQSDVYALGTTAYHLLTGRLPPSAMDITAGLATPPPARTLNPAVSAGASQAIQHAMQLNRSMRTASAAAFKAELGKAAAALASTLPPTVTVPQTASASYEVGSVTPVRQPVIAPARGARPAAYGLGGGLLALFLVIYLLIANANGLWPFGIAATVEPPPPTRVAAALPTELISTQAGEMPTEAGSIMTQAAQTVEAVLETQAASRVTQPPIFTVEPPSPSEPPANAQLGDTWTRPADGMLMHFIPAGEFLMGSADSDPDAQSDEKPQHTVVLDAYWIDQTEVTNATFDLFVQTTGYQTTAEKAGSGTVFNTSTKNWDDIQGADWRHPRGSSSSLDGLENHPVVQVSWDDATAYCAWAGGRLPTEAEWEKAARGADGQIYPWGNQPVAGNLLNFADVNLDADWADKNVDDGYQFTAPVGSYPAGASPYDLLDMAGNVWEWVQDWYRGTYYAGSPASNPTGPSSGDVRVLRGGAWDYVSGDARAASRVWFIPDFRVVNFGFRCVR